MRLRCGLDLGPCDGELLLGVLERCLCPVTALLGVGERSLRGFQAMSGLALGETGVPAFLGEPALLSAFVFG